jgi:hypothetical protein
VWSTVAPAQGREPGERAPHRAAAAAFLRPDLPTPTLPPPPPQPSPRTKPNHHPKVHPGDKVGRGKDDTLFALEAGIVVFKASSAGKSVCVVPVDEYVVPEGQRPSPDSRAAKRRAAYTPRAQQREAAGAAAAVAAVRAAP